MGVQTLAGTKFDLRGFVQLSAPNFRNRGAKFPDTVEGIKIGRKCRQIHFLHSTYEQTDKGRVIGAYHVRFEGQRHWQIEIPLIYGQNVVDWLEHKDTPEPTDAVFAWKGMNPYARKLGTTVQLCKFTWVNPLPDQEIETIDFRTTGTSCGPFLVALTLEP